MSQRAHPSALPCVVPTPVRALGEPEDVFLPSAKVSGSGKLTGSLLALVALGSLGIAGMLSIETPIFHAVWPVGLDLRCPLASKTRFDLVVAESAEKCGRQNETPRSNHLQSGSLRRATKSEFCCI